MSWKKREDSCLSAYLKCYCVARLSTSVTFVNSVVISKSLLVCIEWKHSGLADAWLLQSDDVLRLCQSFYLFLVHTFCILF